MAEACRTASFVLTNMYRDLAHELQEELGARQRYYLIYCNFFLPCAIENKALQDSM